MTEHPYEKVTMTALISDRFMTGKSALITRIKCDRNQYGSVFTVHAIACVHDFCLFVCFLESGRSGQLSLRRFCLFKNSKGSEKTASC